MYQAEIFVEGGRSFANQARLSSMGIPADRRRHGSSTAGGAYLPGLSDYVVLVKGCSSIYLAGPPLVKAAIGEDATDEELGGAEMHASVTGLGEYLTDNHAHAIALTRDLVDKLKWDAATAPRTDVVALLYDEQELLGCISADDREPFDTREVIARIVDGSQLPRIKAKYGHETLCGHARINGHLVGILEQRPDPAERLDQGGAVHPAVRPVRHPHWFLAQHHRLHGGQDRRAHRRHQAWRQDDPGRGQCPRPEVHRGVERLVWRGQLPACAAGL